MKVLHFFTFLVRATHTLLHSEEMALVTTPVETSSSFARSYASDFLPGTLMGAAQVANIARRTRSAPIALAACCSRAAARGIEGKGR